MSRNKEYEPTSWESGVARYASNIQSAEGREESFYLQLGHLPDKLVEGMLAKITEGVREFDNLGHKVTLLGPPHIMTATMPSIGVTEFAARLLVEGRYPQFGIPNPQPWRREEDIVYAKVEGNVYAPDASTAILTPRGREFDEMDALFWQTLDDERMQKRIEAVWERDKMIREGKLFQKPLTDLKAGEVLVLPLRQLSA